MKYNKKEKTWLRNIKEGFEIFIGKGIPYWKVVLSIFSNVFWLWLTIGFIRFGIMSVFGLYGAMNKDYSYALQSIIDNKVLWNTITWGVGIILIVSNVPLWKKKHE